MAVPGSDHVNRICRRLLCHQRHLEMVSELSHGLCPGEAGQGKGGVGSQRSAPSPKSQSEACGSAASSIPGSKVILCSADRLGGE